MTEGLTRTRHDWAMQAQRQEALVAKLEGYLASATHVIENALTGVENLPDYGNQDAAGYLVNDWQPFAKSWLAATEGEKS